MKKSVTVSGARHTIEEKYTGKYGHTDESAIMMKPVIDCASDAFIRCLPDDISIFVDTRNPKDLSEAFEHALHAEEQQTYTEKAGNAASSYHIARPREFASERRRSPSSFSKQMEDSEKQVKSERPSSKGSTTLTITGPSSPTNQAPMYTSMYSQYHLPYLPYQPNYQSQYPYSFPQYSLNYPYPLHYPYPPHPAMMQYPPVEKGQKAPGNSSWKGQSKISGSMSPPRSASTGPSGALNSQSTRRSDAVTSHFTTQERP